MRVRVVGTDLWARKRNPYYVFLAGCRDPLSALTSRTCAHLWVEEKYAKVWTDLRPLRQLATMGRRGTKKGYPNLEVVHADGTVEPLDKLCPPPA